MMRDQIGLLPLLIGRNLLLFIFDGIVKEEIDEDGVESGFGVLAKDFAPKELDAPDTAACGWKGEGE